MALPDRFKCIIVNWDYMYNLCRDVSSNVKDSEVPTQNYNCPCAWWMVRRPCDVRLSGT